MDDIRYSVYDGREGVTMVEIHERESHYKGERVIKLDKRQKEKMENHIVLSYPKERLQVVYT